MLSWDFTVTQNIGQVPWPSGLWGKSSAFQIDVKGKIRVVVTKSNTFEERVENIRFNRLGSELQYVEIEMDGDSREATLATAKRLANQFNIPSARIDAWGVAVLSDHMASAQAFDFNADPITQIEIFPAIFGGPPYRIVFSINWAVPRSRNVATTGPSKSQ